MLTCSLATQKYLKSMFFSFLPSIFQSGRCFFICWRYVANFGILWHRKAPSGNKQARPVCKFRANKKLIIVSPNKTNPKKAMQFHRYGIFWWLLQYVADLQSDSMSCCFLSWTIEIVASSRRIAAVFLLVNLLGLPPSPGITLCLGVVDVLATRIVPRKINK